METAHWWASGETSDEDYISSIWYLLENRILRMPVIEH